MSSNDRPSLRHLEKLRIIEGDDMFPSIYPEEMLLLDRSCEPKKGDVVLFRNRFGIRIAHRLIFRVGQYCFTRGDNCPIINFPCKRSEIEGVIAGKYSDVENSFCSIILLWLFLQYYLLYKIIFDVKKKKQFLLLDFISRYFAALEGIYYKSGYDNKCINSVIYGKKIFPKAHQGYYIRKARDNFILDDSRFLFKGRYSQAYAVMKNSVIKNSVIKNSVIKNSYINNSLMRNSLTMNSMKMNSLTMNSMMNPMMMKEDQNADSYGIRKYYPGDRSRLFMHCIRMFGSAKMTLYDVKCINRMISESDLEKLEIKDLGMHELIGFPLVVTLMFNIKYGFKVKGLSAFIRKNYQMNPDERKRVDDVRKYLEMMGYEMPIQLFHYYTFCVDNTMKTFKIYRFLHPPRGFDVSSKRYAVSNYIIWLLFRLKRYRMNNYIRKKI